MTAADKSSPLPDANMEVGYLRMVEALLFAATEPLDLASLTARLPEGLDVLNLLERLQE